MIVRARRASALRDVIGAAAALVFVLPIAWAALASFKPEAEAVRPPLPPWPTTGLSLATYHALDGFGAGVARSTANSLAVALLTVLLSCAFGTLAGYGFSRFRFPGRGLLFGAVLATIMVPFQSILTPLFLLMSRIGLADSLVGLSLVYTTLQLPLSVFLMRNAFDTVPRELEQAALLDGCGSIGLLVRVMLPIARPSLATVAIFAFITSWNEFLAALTLLTGNAHYTLPVLMSAVRNGTYGSVDWGAVQAGITVMMVPCLVVFLVLQRHYVRGLAAGAVK